MNYRREIDGLRALAVLPVILFHAGFRAFAGGFVGVDVFFVISGYLITSIILAEQHAGRFSLLRFYERRARRVLPALYLVLATCIPLAWSWLAPDDLNDFSKSVVAVSVFASNILFWRQSGYFDTAAELKPLLHTWSLAVEEQYYILFPLFLILASRFGRRATARLLMVAGLASLAVAQWGAYHRPSAAFFLLPTRGWELAFGALTAIFLSQRSEFPVSDAARESASGIGLLCIVFAVFAFSTRTPFPGVYALVPTIGTVLIILFATPATRVGRILGTKGLVAVGLISYSAYLWHQPLFALARHRSLTQPGTGLLLGLAVLSICVSYLSWRFVEQPFRQKGKISRARVFAFAAAGCVVFIAVGTYGHFSHVFDDKRSVSWLNGRALPRKFTGIVRDGENCSGRDPEWACQLGARDAAHTIVVAGDSHARVLTEAFNALSLTYRLRLVDLTSSGCPFFLGLNVYVNGVLSSRCDSAYQEKRLALLKRLAPSTVILHARYPLYVEGRGFDNTVGGVEMASRYSLAAGPNSDMTTSLADLKRAFVNTVKSIQALGHQVVIVGSVPPNGWDPVVRLYRIDRMGLGRSVEERAKLMAIPYSAVREWDRASEDLIREVASNSDGAMVIDPTDLFCSGAWCSSVTESSVLYSDSNHLSFEGSSMVVARILRRLGIARPATIRARLSPPG